jgi:hypothetical protein
MSNTVRTEAQRSRWWREPLLHFTLLGGLLFAVDYALVARESDPNTIVVDAAVVEEAKQVFRSSRNRDPNSQELQALTRRWIDNEILFRVGMALGVDQGDDAIRERVIFKSLMVMETGLKLPPADDATLRSWFETQRAKYDEPARYDFQEAVLTDDDTEAGAQAFARLLNTGTPGEAKAGLRVFKGRPHANLVQSYSPDFVQALESGVVGEWRALQTPDGWRVMRLDALSPAKAAVFENVRNVVLQDWTDATMAELRTQAVRERGKKYKLKFEQAAS